MWATMLLALLAVAFADLPSASQWTSSCLRVAWPLYTRNYAECLLRSDTCAQVIQVAVDHGCGCHPLVTGFIAIFGEEEIALRSWQNISCPEASTLSLRQCPGKPDVQVLAERIGLFLNETRAFLTIGEDIKETLVAAAKPGATLFWPMIGSYTGHDSMVEYIRIGDWSLNQGWFQPLRFLDESVMVSVGQEDFWLNGTVQFAFFGNLSDVEWQPVVNRLLYQDKCDVQYIHHFYNLAPDPSQNFRMPFGERMSSVGVAYHGSDWVCDKIMSSCIGNLSQFEDKQDCVAYFGGLPLLDSQCAATGQFGMGESQRCKLIHVFMVESEPAIHCAHVGKRHDLDGKGQQKCFPSQCSSPLSTTLTTSSKSSAATFLSTTTSTTSSTILCSGWKQKRECINDSNSGVTVCSSCTSIAECTHACEVFANGMAGCCYYKQKDHTCKFNEGIKKPKKTLSNSRYAQVGPPFCPSISSR